MKQIFVGCDHRAYHLRKDLLEYIRGLEYEVKDMSGNVLDTEDDYTDIAIPVAEAVVHHRGRGILVCGSGSGMCVAANKVRGARASLFVTEGQVIDSVRDDDINIACFGADITDLQEIKNLVGRFLREEFLPTERFVRRINKIAKYENTSFYK